MHNTHTHNIKTTTTTTKKKSNQIFTLSQCLICSLKNILI